MQKSCFSPTLVLMLFDVFQLIGFGAMIGSCVGSALKSPRASILAFLISNLFWMVHYFGIGAIGALWMSCLITIRMGIGFFASDKLIKQTMPVFMIISLIAILAAWEGMHSLVLIVAALSGHAVILYRHSGLSYRLMNLLCMISWLIYHIAVGSYGGILNDVIQIIIFAFVLFSHDLRNSKNKIRDRV